MKQCSNCKRWKSQTDFYKDKSSKSGLTYSCKECITKRRQARSSYNKEYMRKLRNSDPDKVKTSRNNSYRNSDIQLKLLRQSLNRSLKKNIYWNLTKKDIVVPNTCPILRVPFEIGTKHNYTYTHSLDRIDNSKGYTADNIQVISMKANSMKNSATPLELVNFAKWVLSNDDIVRAAQIMENINKSAEPEI